MWPFDRKHRAWTKAVMQGLREARGSFPTFPVGAEYKACATWAVEKGYLEFIPGLGDRYVRLPAIQKELN